MDWRHAVLAAMLAMVVIPGRVAAAQDEPLSADEQIFKSVNLASDGPSLLEFLRIRSKSEANAAEIQRLIQQLGDEQFKVREKALAALVRIGPPAAPFLTAAQKSPDVETSRRAADCLKYLEKDLKDALPRAAVRLLAQRRPEGAAEVLLDYLASAGDETIAEEVRLALAVVGFRAGLPDKSLLKALETGPPNTRALAAEILGNRGGPAFLPDIKRLLQDPDALVRLRAALVVADLRDRDAVPVLIDLIKDLPADQLGRAEAGLRDLAGSQAPAVMEVSNPVARRKYQDSWIDWWRKVDDQALLDAFRGCTLTEERRQELLAWIGRLGHDDYGEREQASAELLRIGAPVVPLLHQALRNNPDVEVVRRAERCLRQIENDQGKANPAGTCRLLALRKPAEAAAVLIAYLPFVHDESSAEEVQSALNVLAFREGQPAPALLQALEDKVPGRRSAAAVALGQTEAGRHIPQVQRLLHDRDPKVRLAVAFAWAKLKDKNALPVLIELLGELPPGQLWQIDDFLRSLAADRAPPAPQGDDETSRRQYARSWSLWWQDRGSKLDLDHLDLAPRLLGYTLLVLPNAGLVRELGADGKTRWELTGLLHPFDAQVLPNGRVLVAEYQGRRVTERNLKNDVVWEKKVTWPISCQRLPNGHTFIATRNQLLEVDAAGKDVVTITRPAHDLLAAQKLSSGEIGCIVNSQRYLRLDSQGKELHHFAVGPVHGYVQFDALPGGSILVPQHISNKVVEYDAEGKVLWEAPAQFPYSAQRLPTGRTLVSSLNTNQIVEIDRQGRVVWERKLDQAPWRAKRR